LTFLAAGGSIYPIDLLKDAGVDMTTEEPLRLTLQKMNRVMDEMERILASRAARQASGRAAGAPGLSSLEDSSVTSR
jgi:oligoendopeptidase F